MLHDLAKSDWQQLLRIPERFIRDGCLDRRHRGVWLGHDRSLAGSICRGYVTRAVSSIPAATKALWKLSGTATRSRRTR